MEIKPGYLTTEFWSTQILHVITALVTVSSLTGHTPFDASGLQPLIPVAALIMSALAQAAYNHGRAKLKAAPVPNTATTDATAMPPAVPDLVNGVPPFNG